MTEIGFDFFTLLNFMPDVWDSSMLVNSSGGFALHEHAERAAQMFGMRERLKLARARRVPFTEGIFFHRGGENAREKLRLRGKNFGRPTSFFANFLDRGKIDVRGQILFADIREQIVAHAMAMIRAQRSAQSARRKYFIRAETIINRHQFSIFKNARRRAPPIFGGGRGFNRVTIRQNFQKRRWKIEDGRWQSGRQ